MVWLPIRALTRQRRVSSLRVLDLATGAGDVPIGLWRRARRDGCDLHIQGCDRSPGAIAYATQQAARTNTPVGFFELDAIANDIPTGFDVIMTSLFLHHLTDAQAVSLLRRMAQAANHLVLVNDLVRSRAGLALAHLGTRALTRSEIVHHDGPQSVRAAFTLEEARQLAQRGGLEGAAVMRRWPCRFLMSWTRR